MFFTFSPPPISSPKLHFSKQNNWCRLYIVIPPWEDTVHGCTYCQGTLFHGHVHLTSKTDMTESIPNDPPIGLGLRFDITLRSIVTQEVCCHGSLLQVWRRRMVAGGHVRELEMQSTGVWVGSLKHKVKQISSYMQTMCTHHLIIGKTLDQGYQECIRTGD